MNQLLRAGHTVTPQRRRIAQALLASDRALTAHELLARLSASGPAVGLMTVYRTLALLGAVGAVYAIKDRHGDPGEGHYVFCSDRHHHHVICTSCWRVWEVEGCGVAPAQQQRVERATGVQVEGHALDFFGTCQACRGA